MAAMTPAPETRELNQIFNHHPPPNEYVAEQHQTVRGQCKLVAQVFEMMLPEGDEKKEARKKLEEAMFWANAAIARRGSDVPSGGTG